MAISKAIKLPQPIKKGAISLEEAISRRRSVRDFLSQPLSLSQVSQLLWAGQGITNSTQHLRAAASAGATYPLEIFVVCGGSSVEGLADGVYHYDIDSHSLAIHYKGDVRPRLAQVALRQECIHQAPLDIVICAQYERTLPRYGSRGVRYVHMEAGHASQNIYLEAAALGLATVAIGAFNDEQVREALSLPKQYQPLYIMPVGKPAPG